MPTIGRQLWPRLWKLRKLLKILAALLKLNQMLSYKLIAAKCALENHTLLFENNREKKKKLFENKKSQLTFTLQLDRTTCLDQLLPIVHLYMHLSSLLQLAKPRSKLLIFSMNSSSNFLLFRSHNILLLLQLRLTCSTLLTYVYVRIFPRSIKLVSNN